MLFTEKAQQFSGENTNTTTPNLQNIKLKA